MQQGHSAAAPRPARTVVFLAYLAFLVAPSLVCATAPIAAVGDAEGEGDAWATLEVASPSATVGERIAATLTIALPIDVSLEPPILGPELGSFTVNDGAWAAAERRGVRMVWTWSGSLSAFRLGEQVIPQVTVRIRPNDDPSAPARLLSTDPVTVTLVSVLDAEQGIELADLKPPASVPPSYRVLVLTLLILAVVAIAWGIAWWLQRRYAHRLAAAKMPADPFHRTPPHVWVYAELQKLLERKLPEEGRIDEFYAALSTILKRYLTGRYRVELLEQTTSEVPPALHQAGAPEPAIEETQAVLLGCDRVKFARDQPEPAAWKAAVEAIYRIVDRTKPVESVSPSHEGVA